MKKLFAAVLLLTFMLPLCYITSGFANDKNYYGEGYYKYRKKGKMRINLAAVPTSINGTYEIDRLIIRNGEKTLLDSDNDFSIVDHKGFFTINMAINKDNITLEAIYSMQMVGPAFQNPEIKDYAFLYDKKIWTFPFIEGSSLAETLKKIGITVYDSEDIYLELPFESDKKIMMKIEKETDYIMQLTDKPYFKPY